MTESVLVSVADPRLIGARFVGFGPGWTVESVAYAGETGYGGLVERQRYRVLVTKGDRRLSFVVTGDSRIPILPILDGFV